jgi:hypothetical protein
MAQILRLPFVLVDIVGQHPDHLSDPRVEVLPPVVVPAVPDGVDAIPAMTTLEERSCYYRLTRACVDQGAIVELGAWLGAATAYMAAAVRDSGVSAKVHTFDRFVWKPSSHDKKAGGPIAMSQLEAFSRNLGTLLPYVDAHAVELKRLRWDGGPVALLVCDAPKRIPEISAALTAFTAAIQPGTLLAWQDFAYFPSYDIPAALMRLGPYLEFTEAVYPGTTAVFRVARSWRPEAVSPSALALQRWSPNEVEAAWDAWGERLPLAMRPRFACGAAMFLCDLGAPHRATRRLETIIAAHGDAVLPKWRYLLEERASLMQRYQPLAEVVRRCA